MIVERKELTKKNGQNEMVAEKTMLMLIHSTLNGQNMKIHCPRLYSSFLIEIFVAAICGTRTIFNGSKVDIKF